MSDLARFILVEHCTTCDSTGIVGLEPRICARCRGTGRVLRHSHDRRSGLDFDLQEKPTRGGGDHIGRFEPLDAAPPRSPVSASAVQFSPRESPLEVALVELCERAQFTTPKEKP